MGKPLKPPVGAANLGGAALAAPMGKDLELGVVVSYASGTHTATVRTHSGRPLQNVPRIKQGPGDFDNLPTGITVVITWGLGFAAILGVIDDVGMPQAAIPSMSLTGVDGVGSADPTQTTRGTNTYAPPNAPIDTGPGDWSRVGKLGEHFALLEGGVALMGSPTAQVRSIGSSGTLQTVARQVQQFTDFGRVSVENREGKTSLVMRAGSNQSTETGMDEQHWTIRFDLGATGDVMDFRVSDPEGKTLFRLHAGSDGRVQLYGDGGVDISSGEQGTAEHRGDVAGSKTTKIGGNRIQEIGGSSTTTIDQASTTTIAGDETTSISGSMAKLVVGDRVLGVGGSETTAIGESREITVGANDALTVKDAWSVTCVKATVTARGPVTITSQQRTRVDGSMIVLGKNGKHPLPKFDVFLSDLQHFLSDLLSAIGALAPSNPFSLAIALGKISIFAAKVGVKAPYISNKVKND